MLRQDTTGENLTNAAQFITSIKLILLNYKFCDISSLYVQVRCHLPKYAELTSDQRPFR